MYGEAFREPTAFEIADDRDPDAEPAKLRSYELNYSQLIGRNARVFLAGYQNTVTNFLSSVSSIIGTGVGEVEEQRVRGAEFRMDARFGKWISFVNGSFIIDAEQDYIVEVAPDTYEEKTRDVLSIAEERANVGVSYNFTNHWALSALYAYTGAYDALSGNTDIDEPFEIHAADEVNVTLSVRDIKMDDLKLDGFLTVTNLTDKEIYHANIRQSGTHKFLQDGRAVYLRLAAKW